MVATAHHLKPMSSLFCICSKYHLAVAPGLLSAANQLITAVQHQRLCLWIDLNLWQRSTGRGARNFAHPTVDYQLVNRLRIAMEKADVGVVLDCAALRQIAGQVIDWHV